MAFLEVRGYFLKIFKIGRGGKRVLTTHVTNLGIMVFQQNLSILNREACHFYILLHYSRVFENLIFQNTSSATSYLPRSKIRNLMCVSHPSPPINQNQNRSYLAYVFSKIVCWDVKHLPTDKQNLNSELFCLCFLYYDYVVFGRQPSRPRQANPGISHSLPLLCFI